MIKVKKDSEEIEDFGQDDLIKFLSTAFKKATAPKVEKKVSSVSQPVKKE